MRAAWWRAHPEAPLFLMVAGGAAYALFIAANLGAPDRLRLADMATSLVSITIGVWGAHRARALFLRGEFYHRVWSALLIANLALLLHAMARGRWLWLNPDAEVVRDPLLPLRVLLLVANNVIQSYAFVLFSRAYARARLEASAGWKSWVGWAALAPAFAVVAVLAPTYWGMLHAPGREPLIAVAEISSTGGDLVTLMLFVPLFRGAVGMRGGRLRWVWWAIVGSGVIWLVYDASVWLAWVLPGGVSTWQPLFEVFRAMGLSSVGVAGIVQRLVMPRMESETDLTSSSPKPA